MSHAITSGGELSALTRQSHVAGTVINGTMLFRENQSMGLASLRVSVATNLKANVQLRALVPAFSVVLRSLNPTSTRALSLLSDLGLVTGTTVMSVRGEVAVLPSGRSYTLAQCMTVQAQHCPRF